MAICIIIQILLILLVLFFVIFTGYEIMESQKKYMVSPLNKTQEILSSETSEKGGTEIPQTDKEKVPFVSVLLPVCNEIRVVHQLINAVANIKYDPAFYEILLLDDSDADNAELIK